MAKSHDVQLICTHRVSLHLMKILFLLTTVVLFSVHADADWPRLRGVNGDGKADGSLPLKWSDTENLKWKATLPGPGSSSPIIIGDKVFITCWSGYADGTGDDMSKMVRHLISINKTDGKIIWDKTVPAVQPEDFANGMLMEHGYASSTPVSDGSSVFVFFGKSGALAFDMDGKQLWQTSVGTNSNRKGWGSASSPILHKDTVIITAYDEGGAMVALDKKTGKQIWRAPAEGLDTVYSTPLISGGDLIIPVASEVWGLNPDSGKLRWYATYNMGGNVSPGVTVVDGTLFVTGGYPTAGTAAIRLGGKGDITTANTLWSINSASYIPTPIHHEGHLYVVNDAGFAMCIEAKTGEEIYRERVMENSAGQSGGGRRGGGKPFYASPVLVGGNLYCPSRKNGVFVIAAKPTFEVIAKNTFASDSSQMNGTPAFDANRLYLRSDRALYCIGE
jgi:outer membrane protein assembly factor BamB